jgi:hypothetical protein
MRDLGWNTGKVQLATASIAVFAIAIALRAPSCYESFWVDELHSAWCVWNGLGDVAPRADSGHQSPFYFVGLWFWKQCFGGSELALRFSSVLCVAASCVVLTVGTARHSGSLLAGFTAGMILAIEENSLFFGTELRPFAVVMLLASMASVCFLRLASCVSRHDDRSAWVTMIVTILLAGLSQPTSLGALLLLPIMLIGIWLLRDPRSLLRISLADGILLLGGAAVLFSLWSMTLDESWGQRHAWASFASATSLVEVWQVWQWTWLWILPVATLIIVVCNRDRSALQVAWPLLALAIIPVAGTLGYWTVSKIEWLPLWHRRYFIAVLPMFATLAGGAVGAVVAVEKLRAIGVVVAITLVVGICYHQRLYRPILRYPVPLVRRGEDWRGAIQWVRSNVNSQDALFLEAGLIESRFVAMANQQQREFLLYPVSGPYQVDQLVTPIDASLDLPARVLYDDQKQVFLIVRRSANRIPIDSTKWGWVYGNRLVGDVKSFGNVTVIRMPRPLGDKQREPAGPSAGSLRLFQLPLQLSNFKPTGFGQIELQAVCQRHVGGSRIRTEACR